MTTTYELTADHVQALERRIKVLEECITIFRRNIMSLIQDATSEQVQANLRYIAVQMAVSEAKVYLDR